MSAEARFCVLWIPTDDVERIARADGWTEEGGTSFWDHMEPETCEVWEPFPTFASALVFAQSKIEEDVFGAPRIEKEELGFEDYGDFVVRDWERIMMWEVPSDGEIAEDSPTVRY